MCDAALSIAAPAGAEFDALSDAAISRRNAVVSSSVLMRGKAEGRVGFHVHMRRLQSVGPRASAADSRSWSARFSFPLFPGIAQAMRIPQDFRFAFGGIAKKAAAPR